MRSVDFKSLPHPEEAQGAVSKGARSGKWSFSAALLIGGVELMRAMRQDERPPASALAAIQAGRKKMPTLITGDRLREAVDRGTFIKDGDPANAEGIKYDFRMGSRILKAKYSQPIDVNDLPVIDRDAMGIDHGEAVFVLTKERLTLPKDIIALLSSKRKLSHNGIILLGSLAADPLYNGPLWIGLYNISSTPFPLMPGRKLIAALFYELSEQKIGEFTIPEAAGTGDFPDELINLIKKLQACRT